MRTVWFDSLTELSITDIYNSVICKLRSLNILKAQIEEIDKKLKEYWNELIYLSTTKEQYQELSSSLIKRDLANCKKIIKESCKIGEKFQYKNKEYETTQSGILAGIYLIDKIKISDVKNYLLKGTSFPQVEEFKEYMSKFEKYNMEALFGKFVVDLAPIARGNYESNFKNNPNGVAGQKCENSASNKIMIKNYRLNYYSLNVPNYIDENGVEKNIDNTTVKKDYVIEDITPQGKAVCNGAMIKCSGSLGGTYPLTILPKINIFMNDKPIGVLSNSKIGENISNFGMCKLTSNPSVSLNQNKPFACKPVQISQWTSGISYFAAGDEKVISDKSTCMCSYGGLISIEKNQEGQTFFGYANGGSSAENGKEDKSEEDKKKEEEEKEKSEKLKGKVDNGVDGKVDNINKLCYPIDLKFRKGKLIESFDSGGGRFGSSRDDRFHAGIDFYAPLGTPIYAIADGEVINGPYHFYLGSYALEIKHDISSVFPEFKEEVVIRYCEILGFNKGKAIYDSKFKDSDLKKIEEVHSIKLENFEAPTIGKTVKKGQLLGYVGLMNLPYLINLAKNGKEKGGTMLHLELYKGTATGELTKKGNTKYDYVEKINYGRRIDLLNPTKVLFNKDNSGKFEIKK